MNTDRTEFIEINFWRPKRQTEVTKWFRNKDRSGSFVWKLARRERSPASEQGIYTEALLLHHWDPTGAVWTISTCERVRVESTKRTEPIVNFKGKKELIGWVWEDVKKGLTIAQTLTESRERQVRFWCRGKRRSDMRGQRAQSDCDERRAEKIT